MTEIRFPPPPPLPREEQTPPRSRDGQSLGGVAGQVELRSGKTKVTVPVAVIVALLAGGGTYVGTTQLGSGDSADLRQEIRDLRQELREFRHEVRQEQKQLRDELRGR